MLSVHITKYLDYGYCVPAAVADNLVEGPARLELYRVGLGEAQGLKPSDRGGRSGPG